MVTGSAPVGLDSFVWMAILDAYTMTQSPSDVPKSPRLRYATQLVAALALGVGCYLVLRPFISAILFEAVVCYATWPAYVLLRKLFRCSAALSAFLMSVLLVVLLIAPSLLLVSNLSEHVVDLASTIKSALGGGPIPAPKWLVQVPFFGDVASQYWESFAPTGESLLARTQGLVEPARDFFITSGKAVGQGLAQLVLSAFLGFFFFRDGDLLVAALKSTLKHIAGGLASEILVTVQGTVIGVVHGIFGTALAQALVAVAGFLLAGVPGVLLLGAGTFLLSVVPVGPPLIWGGAAVWLLYHGKTGAAIFIALWGLLFISAIDNVVKPYLISRSSNLPVLLIVLGVIGGVVAFGFVGVFIGPPLLAVGMRLARLWLESSAGAREENALE